MLDRDSGIARAMSITSALTQAECDALWDSVMAIPSDKPIVVEIGAYLGRSSAILALATQERGGRFFTIDPFYETDIEVCRENIKRCGVTDFTIIHKRSELAGKDVPSNIDFLFDDGDHQEVGVFQDCEIYIKKVKVGGRIAFHDYNSSWVDVRTVVDSRPELLKERLVDSMMICQRTQ